MTPYATPSNIRAKLHNVYYKVAENFEDECKRNKKIKTCSHKFLYDAYQSLYVINDYYFLQITSDPNVKKFLVSFFCGCAKHSRPKFPNRTAAEITDPMMIKAFLNYTEL